MMYWNDVYKASKDSNHAEQYVNDFVEAIATKKMFPFSEIPLEYSGLFTGYYYVNFKKYKAFYRVRDSYIEVTRIIMAKKNYMNIIFGGSLEE